VIRISRPSRLFPSASALVIGELLDRRELYGPLAAPVEALGSWQGSHDSALVAYIGVHRIRCSTSLDGELVQRGLMLGPCWCL